MTRQEQVATLEKEWRENPRWANVKRGYGAEDVVRLRGSIQPENTLARLGAEKLWKLVNGGAKKGYVNSLGAITGGQAMQQAKAGIEAIYLSGWQVAADGNSSETMYPDQSLYAYDSVPAMVRRINNTFRRADEIQWARGTNPGDDNYTDYFIPIVADAEAGFGGVLNAYELMKNMIANGAAGVHFEDQLAAVKKCGHMGGKVLVSHNSFIQKLISARLAADVAGIPTVLIARTDANGAQLLQSDHGEVDEPFLTGETTPEGFKRIHGGLEIAIARALEYAPYSDMIWCETSKPDVGEAREFAQAIHEKFPGKMLAYNCSPSFNWKANLDDKTIADYQNLLGEMGYKFQFVTLAGFHSLNTGMFELARGYKAEGMAAYARLQEREFELERDHGYSAVKHQKFVGAGYFDAIQMTVTNGEASTTALKGSTEEEQFAEAVAA